MIYGKIRRLLNGLEMPGMRQGIRKTGNKDHYCVKPRTVDEYIALQDEKVQPELNKIRSILRNALPEAEERISWSMPTYWEGRNIIHFAA